MAHGSHPDREVVVSYTDKVRGKVEVAPGVLILKTYAVAVGHERVHAPALKVAQVAELQLAQLFCRELYRVWKLEVDEWSGGSG